ncbi:hypothetical protein AAHN97_01295 [Chitinophaga niabensis]|uniref:hypothetical protein n=1 Tax=Chitinophaga niabensis TaxID=536979 RepID=UPI0031BA8BFE
MQNWIDQFFEAYLEAFPPRTVYTGEIPQEIISSPVDNSGWFEWRLMKGTLPEDAYRKLEDQFSVQFPQSFIAWHRSYFFLDGDCSLLRLPHSNPARPLEEMETRLNWFIPEQLIPQQLYPFATEGNDAGMLVFDGREQKGDNEFPVRMYDYDYEGDIAGLREVIFSSFSKLIECMTHYCRELKHRKGFEIIPDFFQIDQAGAGKSGRDYWMGWVDMMKANFEEFGY